MMEAKDLKEETDRFKFREQMILIQMNRKNFVKYFEIIIILLFYNS